MSVTVRPYRRGGFEVDIQWRSQDGRRHRERKRLDITSKTAAQRWGEGRERELLVRGPTLRRKEVPTLEQFAPRFMDGHARANQAKPSGIAHKELVLKNHLFPTIGKKRLDDITDEDVQQLKFTLRHRKPTTVNNVLSVLSMLLKKAVEWRVLDHPRCMVRLVKRQQGTARFYCEGSVVSELTVRKCRRANARPDPDFRYSSNAFAASGTANSMATSSRHGRPVAVWRESPRLCAASRAQTFAVTPVYQRSGWESLRRM